MLVGQLTRSILIASTAVGVQALYTPSNCTEASGTDGSHSDVCGRSVMDIVVDDLSLLFSRDADSGRAANGTLDGRDISPRVVYSPAITSPTDSTVWSVGSTVEVTWYILPRHGMCAQANVTVFHVTGMLAIHRMAYRTTRACCCSDI